MCGRGTLNKFIEQCLLIVRLAGISITDVRLTYLKHRLAGVDNTDISK